MKKALILAAVLACSLPTMAFNQSQDLGAKQAEFSSRLAAISSAQDLATLVSEARLAGISADWIASALAVGRTNTQVQAALTSGGFSEADAVAAVTNLRWPTYTAQNGGSNNFLGNNAGSNGVGGSGSSASPH